jgi:hypothetical protein
MTADQLPTREEHLQKLESFCKSLDGLFARAGLTPEQSEEVWRVGVAAQCVQCGIHVYGEELHALSQPPSEKYATAKLGRLRLGDCARQGCNSYYYRLTFYPYGDLDWRALLASLDGKAEETGKKTAEESMFQHGWKLLVRSPAAQRVALGLVLVMLLLVVRQWRIGGRIPLLREPQKFQVAPESGQFAVH